MPHLTRKSLLYRAMEIAVLCIVACTALGYPLSLKDTWLDAIIKWVNNPAWANQIIPWLSGGFTPLLLKESIFLTLFAALLFLFIWKKIKNQVLGLEPPTFGSDKPLNYWLQKPEAWAAALMLYTALSVAWSEVFQQSLQTWVLLATGTCYTLIVRSVPNPQRLILRFLVLVTLCGALLAITALLQHLGISPFLYSSTDPRNRMSSLIGHNTGLSCWLMFPLSFSVYFLVTHPSRWVKVICVALLVLFVTVIIAAQSRAVWVLALLLLVFLPMRIARGFQWKLKISHWLSGLAALLAIVAALSLSPQTNRLANLPISLAQRVTGDIFNLDQLRRETRLRILVVSLNELLPQHPVFGSGLGSFSWEYPKAQGEYFMAHPNSVLGTTERRTDLAHNDYLQMLVETGLLGAILLGGLMWCMACELRRSLANSASPWQHAQWLTLVLPSGAVAAQALVDFPFHIVPIAVVTLTSVALASQIGQSKDAPSELPSPSSTEISPSRLRRAGLIALGFTAVIFSVTPLVWNAFVGRMLLSDVYQNQGMYWLNQNAQAGDTNIDRQLQVLDRARRSFREAVVTNVFNGEAYEGQATAQVIRAGIVAQRYLEVSAEDKSSTMILPLRANLLRDCVQATSITEAQLISGGLRYHYTYYLLGRAYRLMWVVEKNENPTVHPDDSEAFLEARKALQTALAYNQADGATVRELADMLLREPEYYKEGLKLQRRFFELDPYSADKLILQPAITRARIGETTAAREMLGVIFEEFPDNPWILQAMAWLSYYEAVWPPESLDVEKPTDEELLNWRRIRLDEGRPALNALPDEEPFADSRRKLMMLYAAASGDIQRANELSSQEIKRDIWDREAKVIYYWTQHELHGGELQKDEGIEYYRAHALLSLYFLPDRLMGINLAELAGRQGLPEDLKITLPEARRIVAFSRGNKWWEFIGKFLPEIQKRFPDDPVFQQTAELVQRHASDKK